MQSIKQELSTIIKNEVKAAMTEFVAENEFKFKNPLSLGSNARYLTRSQLASYLGIGMSTVDYWARIGKLKKLYIDGTVRFDKNEIDLAIKSLRKYSGSTSIFSPQNLRA